MEVFLIDTFEICSQCILIWKKMHSNLEKNAFWIRVKMHFNNFFLVQNAFYLDRLQLRLVCVGSDQRLIDPPPNSLQHPLNNAIATSILIDSSWVWQAPSLQESWDSRHLVAMASGPSTFNSFLFTDEIYWWLWCADERSKVHTYNYGIYIYIYIYIVEWLMKFVFDLHDMMETDNNATTQQHNKTPCDIQHLKCSSTTKLKSNSSVNQQTPYYSRMQISIFFFCTPTIQHPSSSSHHIALHHWSNHPIKLKHWSEQSQVCNSERTIDVCVIGCVGNAFVRKKGKGQKEQDAECECECDWAYKWDTKGISKFHQEKRVEYFQIKTKPINSTPNEPSNTSWINQNRYSISSCHDQRWE